MIIEHNDIFQYAHIQYVTTKIFQLSNIKQRYVAMANILKESIGMMSEILGPLFLTY